MERIHQKKEKLKGGLASSKFGDQWWFVCIALIDGSNLDASSKLNVESVASSAQLSNRLTIKKTEEAILRMRGTEDDEAKAVLVATEADDETAKSDINWMKNKTKPRSKYLEIK